jgi:hypothetical protein
MTSVSCSDGVNGLVTRYGWQNQGAVAGFPNIGGYVGIEGWNSQQVCTSNTASTHLILIELISAELATASHTTARPSTFLPLTILRTASTSPRELWTSLPTASLCNSDASTHSTNRLVSTCVGSKLHALYDMSKEKGFGYEEYALMSIVGFQYCIAVYGIGWRPYTL